MSADNRRNNRHRCQMGVEVETEKGRTYSALVVDISESGMCISTDRAADIWAGQCVRINSDELGCLSGKTRWRRSDTVGIQFSSTTDTKAKVRAFQKYFIRHVAEDPAASQRLMTEVVNTTRRSF